MKKIFKFYALPLYILVHPFDGFYEMKHQQKGTLKLALFNFLMVCVSVSFLNQYTSLRIVTRHPHTLSSLQDFIMLTVALLLFCVANWAVTTLTDGEGKFKEILMACCYAMTPIVLTFIPLAGISNAMAEQESGFFFMILYFAIAYAVLLGFIGLVSIHNYTPSKAIITIFLTFIAVLIIVFLFALLLTLWQQLVVFVNSIYIELMFRR